MFCIVLCEPYYRQEFLDLLNNIPDMSWEAQIPEHFKERTQNQMKAMFSQNKQTPTHFAPYTVQNNIVDLPTNWSWLDQKPQCLQVQDIGFCQGFWNFVSVDAASDARCIAGKDVKRVQYSPQYQFNCDKDPNDLKCSDFLIYNQSYLVTTGMPTNTCIPFTSGDSGRTGTCPTKCTDGSALQFTKLINETFLYVTDDNTLMNLLQNNTLETNFTVFEDFMYYKSGVYVHKTGFIEGFTSVEFVGYGTANGTDFWVIKNCWSQYWGENGYFRIQRRSNEFTEWYTMQPVP